MMSIFQYGHEYEEKYENVYQIFWVNAVGYPYISKHVPYWHFHPDTKVFIFWYGLFC